MAVQHFVEVPGLVCASALLDPEQQAFCVGKIDAAAWNGGIEHRRRTQHYGWVYDYRARAVPDSAFLGPLPSWLARLGAALNRRTGLDVAWVQAIVNEYQPGVGIGEHSDSAAFGAHVATVSLLSSTTTIFRPRYGAVSGNVLVTTNPGDALVMSGPARRPWTHEIPGSAVTARRLSVTFRTLAR